MGIPELISHPNCLWKSDLYVCLPLLVQESASLEWAAIKNGFKTYFGFHPCLVDKVTALPLTIHPDSRSLLQTQST